MRARLFTVEEKILGFAAAIGVDILESLTSRYRIRLRRTVLSRRRPFRLYDYDIVFYPCIRYIVALWIELEDSFVKHLGKTFKQQSRHN